MYWHISVELRVIYVDIAYRQLKHIHIASVEDERCCLNNGSWNVFSCTWFTLKYLHSELPYVHMSKYVKMNPNKHYQCE